MLPVQRGAVSETLAVYASKIAGSLDAELFLSSIVTLPHYARQEENPTRPNGSKTRYQCRQTAR